MILLLFVLFNSINIIIILLLLFYKFIINIFMFINILLLLLSYDFIKLIIILIYEKITVAKGKLQTCIMIFCFKWILKEKMSEFRTGSEKLMDWTSRIEIEVIGRDKRNSNQNILKGRRFNKSFSKEEDLISLLWPWNHKKKTNF